MDGSVKVNGIYKENGSDRLVKVLAIGRRQDVSMITVNEDGSPKRGVHKVSTGLSRFASTAKDGFTLVRVLEEAKAA